MAAALSGPSEAGTSPTVIPDASAVGKDPLEPATRLAYFGDYELLEEIARGGMGVVWKARQTSLKRDVAVKMIRAGALASPQEVARFLREAEAAASLQHANIVAIHEVGEHGGQHYFSMDFVAGRDLGALVKDGPVSPQVAARYVRIIAEAIHFAHQRGTLHRDLKPQNVLIDAADQPRITDFGLAKLMTDDSRMTQSGVIMGSPSYMPPEQAAGRQADIGPASDVYSLGAMLYELVTGRPPFRGTTAMATLHEVLETEPVAPRRLKGDVPPDLETICLKCLEKSPTARYSSARALAEELDRFLKGDPILARPASPVRKLVSWGRRHPGLLVAAAALVMVSLTFGIFYLFEENAFLLAQHQDKSLSRVAGKRHESLEIWSGIGTLAAIAGLFLFLTVQRQARGLKWNERVDLRNPFRAPQWQPLQPLDGRTRSIALCGGAVLTCYGVVHLALTIAAYVWEGESIFSQFFPIYSSIYLGLATLGLVTRDYRLVHYGTSAPPDRKLSAEQIESIGRALEDRNFRGAVARYREAVPDADSAEAKQYAIRLFMSLRAQHPERFAIPPLSLATLNWNALLICALMEAVVLLVFCYFRPPVAPASTISQFAYSLLFGMGVVAALRVKGYRKLLLLAPAVVAAILCEMIIPRLVPTTTHAIGPYMCGYFCGMFLMISAFTPGRKRNEEGRVKSEK